MTHIGYFFEREEKRQGLTAKELAERMDIDPVMISRAKHGKQRTFELATLRKMIAGISRQASVRHQLLAAYLCDIRDGCLDPRTIRIEVPEGSSRVAEDAAEYRDRRQTVIDTFRKQHLTDDEVGALGLIAGKLRTDPQLRKIVLSLAEMLRKA